MPRLQSFIGFLALAFLAWLFSENRKKVNVRTLTTGMGLQLLLALLLLKFLGSQEIFLWLNEAVGAIGIPWSEAVTAGSLMGTKTVLNELLAYLDLAALPKGALSERSRLILIYAMCGFANFGSLGIMIGGMGAMVKERRDEIVGLGLRSIVAGTIATCMTGALVGVIYK